MATIALEETADSITTGVGDVVTVSASVDTGARPVFYSPDNGRRLAADIDDLGIWTAAWATSKAGDYAIRIEAPGAAPVIVLVNVEGDGPPAPDYYGTPLLDQAYGARDAAIVARNGAQTARDAAIVARTGAETARTGAQAARTAAEALVLSDLETSDGQMRAVADDPASQFSGAVNDRIAYGLTDDDEPKRVGYELPGPGGAAAFSVDGAISALAGFDQDHRLWSDAPSHNVMSVRNLGLNSDSAIKFLDAETGLERGAIGYHNTFDGPPPENAFKDATFVESSAFIRLDATNVPNAPLTPLRLITTGKIEGQSQGPYARVAMEADGSTYLLYPAITFNPEGVTKALKVRSDYAGVEIEPRLSIGPYVEGPTARAPQANLDVRGNAVVGYWNVDRSGLLDDGFAFVIANDGPNMLRLARTDQYVVDLELGPQFYVRDAVANKVPVALSMNGSGNVTLFPQGVDAENWHGAGQGVLGIRNALTAPVGNPSGGGVLYSQAGALKWRGSDGTVTTVAPA